MGTASLPDNREELSFSTEEEDILQEVMNIAFGKAAADLGKIIDIFVVLSVPNIKVMPGRDLLKYITNELEVPTPFHAIEQSFSGRIRGHALLILPSEAGIKLSTLFDEDPSEGEVTQLTNEETLLEIGNILTGACVGKFVELLKDLVTYSPPRINTELFSPENSAVQNLVDPEIRVISITTQFNFKAQDIEGFLFLVTDQESFLWLKKALQVFMEDFD